MRLRRGKACSRAQASDKGTCVPVCATAGQAVVGTRMPPPPARCPSRGRFVALRGPLAGCGTAPAALFPHRQGARARGAAVLGRRRSRFLVECAFSRHSSQVTTTEIVIAQRARSTGRGGGREGAHPLACAAAARLRAACLWAQREPREGKECLRVFPAQTARSGDYRVDRPHPRPVRIARSLSAVRVTERQAHGWGPWSAA